MENKICVYAICKNEIQFVDRWLESMSEADYIIIVDTGSTDGTYDKLAEDERVDLVYQKEYSPWRFDEPRNDALKHCPKDTTIFVSTDFDEYFDPGWADVLRNEWIPGTHTRALYKYAWSHTSTGEPQRVFYYDKIHGPSWYWKAPVHEYLTSDVYTDQNYINSHSLNVFDKVFLHHFPDRTKSRANYLPLLELRAQEDPDDYYGLYYYAHELYYRGYYEKSIAILDKILTDERFESRRNTLEIAACYLFKGDSFRALDKDEAAISAYNSAIATDPTYREPYLQMAGTYMNSGYYNMAIGIVKEALQKSIRHYTWLERDTSWGAQPDDILSVSYYYLGEYQKAYDHGVKALLFNPTDERLLDNVRCAQKEI